MCETAYFGLVWCREGIPYLSLFDENRKPGFFEAIEDGDDIYKELGSDQFGVVSAVCRDDQLHLQDHAVLTMPEDIDSMFNSGELHDALVSIYELFQKEFVH